jgi:hypothetical protein
MRLTTKIILGIIGGIFSLALLLIIGFSFSDRKDFNSFSENRRTISQENVVPIEIGEFKTVRMSYSDNVNPEIRPFFQGTLSINPTSEEDAKQKLSAPEELIKYINTSIVNDTLFIRFDQEQMHKDFASQKNEYLQINGMTIQLHTQAVDIENTIRGMEVDIRDVKTNHIKVRANRVFINSCEATSVTPIGSDELRIRNSTMHSLNIDLDETRNWTVENCTIQEENLTGSGNNRNTISKSEAKVMNWIPKNSDARLDLHLSGEPAKLVFE